MSNNDLISRMAAHDVINTWGHHTNEHMRMNLLHKDLNAIPAVDIMTVKHGRWILFDKTSNTVICDQCHRQDHFDLLAKYCRYCGARMEGDNDDE